jgi:putative FmdB family regulatory protein
MPIYEYQCTACGHELEAIQKIGDEPLSLCPACNKEELKKLVSASSFRLKGGGWYETDFKTDNKKRIADSGNSEPDSSKTAEKASASTNKDSDKTKLAAEKQTKAKANTSK